MTVLLKSLILGLLFPLYAWAQVAFPSLPQPVQTFAFEDKDWSIQPVTSAKGAPFHAATPTTLPGARVIKTLELKALLDARKDVVVIDVLDSKTRKTIPGAFWMSGAGDNRFYGAERTRFAAALDKLTSADKNRPLVFLCVSSECWLSYNAALHALEAGYKDVIWYRGGTQAWSGASLDTKAPQSVAW